MKQRNNNKTARYVKKINDRRVAITSNHREKEQARRRKSEK